MESRWSSLRRDAQPESQHATVIDNPFGGGKMKLRVIATLVAVLAFGVGSASAQSIGIFGDLGSASCNIAVGGPGTMYINVVGSSALPTGGITGAEFAVGNITTADAFFILTPNPAANVDLGNPFAGGTNVAFPSCQTGPSINLYHVNFFASTDLTGRLISIVAHSVPTNPNFPCSLLNLCDAPIFTKVCVAGGEAYIDGPDCTVAVEETTWSDVKSLFN